MRTKRRAKHLKGNAGPAVRQHYLALAVDRIAAESERAILAQLPDGRNVWLARSQVRDGFEYRRGDRPGVLDVNDWLLTQKGL